MSSTRDRREWIRLVSRGEADPITGRPPPQEDETVRLVREATERLDEEVERRREALREARERNGRTAYGEVER